MMATAAPATLSPADPDIEGAVLGAIMAPCPADVQASALERLGRQCFSDPALARIFDGIVQLHGRGAPVDVLTVGAELERMGSLREIVGGKLRLVDLVASVPLPTNTAYYAEQVVELARRREAIKVCLGAAERLHKGDTLAAIVADLNAISETLANGASGPSLNGQRLGALSRAASLALIAKHSPRWVVDGILASDDYGVLAGPKGVGKTLALIDLATATSLGERWFNRFATVRSRVLVMTSEDSRARLWRRADAVARSLGRDPTELEGWLYIHPTSFSVTTDLTCLKAELAAVEPGLAILDPAYRYMNGTRPQLFDMGAVLTPLQEVCRDAGAPLIVGHHYNRREGASREERLSGAGLLEWARILITVEAPPRRDEDPNVTLSVEITGNSLDPLTFQVTRFVEALEDGPNPELRYAAEVVAEGAKAREVRSMTAKERILAVLGRQIKDARSVKELGDLIARDATGRGGLKADTIRRTLNRDLKDVVDRLESGGEVLWWWPE